MIPAFNHSHVLPPFLGESSTVASSQSSPYMMTMLELIQRCAHLPDRARLMQGLLDYRAKLASLGLLRGFQWLDGSFAEDIEAHEQRAPRDIDLVTFAYSPVGLSSPQIIQLMVANPELFDRVEAKVRFGCDVFLVPLDKSPENLVKRTSYYFGVFSHRRSDHVWKGLLQVPLESDDALARDLLNNLTSGVDHASTA
jgi:hypothetical protein